MLMDLRNLGYYGALCAGTLARAHARTGDAVQISAYPDAYAKWESSAWSWLAQYR